MGKPVTYTYDAENRLIATAGMSYIYDGDGNRVEKCTAGATPGTCAANATGRFYWWLSGSVFAESDLSVNFTAAYGLIRGQIGARIDLPSNTIHYYFHDHLGSTDVVTDALGNVQNESDYYPYGGEIPILSGDTNRYKFNGKERDAESGLDNFGARFDTSAMGRFMTPDWAAKPTTVPYANFGNPQSLNLYSYVENNPTTLGDPDGHGDCTGNDWLACHAPKVAAALADGQQAWTGTVGKLGAATDSLKNATIATAKAAGQSTVNGISKVSDFLNDHPFLTLAATLGMSVEKDGPALEDSLEDAASTVEEEAGAIEQGLASKTQSLIGNANKLNHIFGQSRHNLDGLVSEFGSQEAAGSAIQRATEAAVKQQRLSGTFEIPVQVGTQTITVRGNVVNGAVKIGTAFK